MSFSYNVVQPLLRRQKTPDAIITWNVIEKGHEKSDYVERREISYYTIRSALFQIREHIEKTPLDKSLQLLPTKNFNIYLKKECLQHTDSVKARGVAYTMLQLSDFHKRSGVITTSISYNFIRTLCYYGKKFQIPVAIVMPESQPDEVFKKYLGLLDSNTEMICLGNDILEAHKNALNIAKRRNLYYIDGNDHPNMIIGQATLGIEIIEQLTSVDVVVLPALTDGCGLALGIAAVLKAWNSKIKVIEVQPKVLNALIQEIRSQTTLPNKLEIPVTEYSMYENRAGIIRNLIDKLFEVDEEQIKAAANHLREKENIADSYAAIGLAALQTAVELKDKLKEKSVVIPLFGNVDIN